MNTQQKHVENLEAGRLRLTLHISEGLLREIGLSWATGQGPDATLSPLGETVQRSLEKYVCGKEPHWPELPLDWQQLRPFTAQTLQQLLQNVPMGSTVTYGQLARMAGSPNGARAAGRAVGANPWPLLVPCHRVLGANGALTGFSNPCGLEMKRYLLELEAEGSERI